MADFRPSIPTLQIIEQVRDLLNWWVDEICAMSSRVLQVREYSSRKPSNSSETRDPDTAAGPKAPIFEGRALELPAPGKRLPFSRACEIARSAALDATPFGLDAVHVVPVESGPEQRRSAILVKRDSLGRFLDGVAATGVKPEAFGLAIGGKTIWLPRRALENLHPVFAHLRRRRRRSAILLLGLLLLCVGSYVHILSRYAASEAQLAEVVDVKRQQALQIRKLFDQQQKNLASIEAARHGKDQAVSIARLWEEATRVIPDDAWISDLSFDGQTVTMSGFAARSASLIGDLATSPYFRDPSFISPVVRVAGKAGERFELRARVARP